MASIKDYVKYYKDVSMDKVSFNEVDSMLFTQFVYADFKDIIPIEKGKFILFSDAARLFLRKYDENTKKVPKFIREVYDLIYQLRDAKRYADIKMYHYVKVVDDEKQFCAFTLRFQGKTYVVFEGTDTSLIGWKEDFMLSNTFPVPAQRMALEYLNETIGFFDNEVYVGGHSKGGNLAMTAGMLASSRLRMKIRTIYNFDGPGFRVKEFGTSAYGRMARKLKMFVPEDSTIGMLLLHTPSYQVVKSNVVGVWQHDPLNWECFGGIFIPGTLTIRSANLEKSNIEFIASLNESERAKIIDTIFSIFDKLGIKDTSEIKIPKINQAITLVKEITTLDSDSRHKLITLLKILIKGL
jgi:hypothetical protein